jgi:hypothetical protein
VSAPKDSVRTSVVHGRLFSAHEAHLRLNRLVHGALRAVLHDHPEIALSQGQIMSVSKRVVRQLEGNGYGLEIFLSLVQGGKTGPDVTTMNGERDDSGKPLSDEELLQVRQRLEGRPSTDDAVRLLATVDALGKEKRRTATAQLLEGFQGFAFWLTPEEARAAVAYYAPETGPARPFEREEGPCRACRGTGEMLVRSHCFGQDFEECSNCHGTRMDKQRLRVPELAKVL